MTWDRLDEKCNPYSANVTRDKRKFRPKFIHPAAKSAPVIDIVSGERCFGCATIPYGCDMDLANQEAQRVAEALLERRMGGTAMAMAADGYRLSLQTHPNLVLHFGRDHLDGLLVQYVFDGRRPVRWDYVPSAAGAEALADFVVKQVAGEGGHRPG